MGIVDIFIMLGLSGVLAWGLIDGDETIKNLREELERRRVKGGSVIAPSFYNLDFQGYFVKFYEVDYRKPYFCNPVADLYPWNSWFMDPVAYNVVHARDNRIPTLTEDQIDHEHIVLDALSLPFENTVIDDVDLFSDIEDPRDVPVQDNLLDFHDDFIMEMEHVG